MCGWWWMFYYLEFFDVSVFLNYCFGWLIWVFLIYKYDNLNENLVVLFCYFLVIYWYEDLFFGCVVGGF